MDSYVVKVQFEDKLRRLTFLGEVAFSYVGLLHRIREAFQLPSTAELVLTYTDRDGDVVTMGEDQDLKDALVLQSWNPLRLNVTIVGSDSPGPDTKMADIPAEIRSDDNKRAGTSADATAAAAEKPEQKVHQGIACDDCGVFPIVGRRFKSLRKVDYDLCQHCFEKSGVDPHDYVVMERRFRRPHSRHAFRAFRDFREGEWIAPFVPISDFAFGYHGFRGDRRAATSGFPHRRCGTAGEEVAHEGVECDGCAMSPILGTRFISNTKFDYDLCDDCYGKLDSDDAKAEYTRTERPSPEDDIHRLIFKGLKRLASSRGCPSRRRRVWIMSTINSESDDQEQQETEVAATPPAAHAADGVATKQAETPAGNKEVTMEEAQPGSQSPAGEPRQQQEHAQEPEPLSQADGTDERNNSDTVAQVLGDDDLSTTEGLLGKLAVMGFNDKELNEDLLKKNNLDLRTTVDQLCATKEWTPILEDLQEMGFYDTDMNRRLLIANNGNVKMVVTQLVQKAKEEASAIENLKGKMQA